MELYDSKLNELTQFIEETRQGKYTEESCCIEQLGYVRYDYVVIEDVNRVSENVILYGLSCL